MEFSRLVIPKAPRTTSDESHQKEATYWKSFKNPIFLKSYVPVSHVHFSPSAPHRYVTTSGTRLQIYSPKTNRVVKTVSRFKQNASSGEIRADGKLCVAGDESGLVQIFDVSSRAILRSLSAHKQPVYTTKFSPGSGTQILTTSADTTVRLFDLTTSILLRTFALHTDYVRTASFVPSSPSLIFSGGYDGTVRLWDSRVNGTGQVWLGQHGKPVEDVLVGEAGTMALSAGGPVLRVWDLLGASTSGSTRVTSETEEDLEVDTGTSYCLKALSNHQKSIKKLAWTTGEHDEPRVLSAGLDGLVKVYDPQNNWKVKHTMRYGAGILSFAVSPNSSHIVAGLTDGTLSIRSRTNLKKIKTAEVNYDGLLAGEANSGVVFEGNQVAQGVSGFSTTVSFEKKIKRDKKKKIMIWDRMLKDFRYGDALDSVLRQSVSPNITVALLRELVQRSALPAALGNRDDISLEPILLFLIRHVTDPKYSALLADVSQVLIDIYTPALGLSPLIDELFIKLRTRIRDELEFQKELYRVRGALELIFAASQHVVKS